MAVGERDRRLLWGRSGNRCAKCQIDLAADRTSVDREALIGEEAHIAARSLRGPRFDDLPEGVSRDSYENLILLCSVCHRTVDGQPNYYTVARLHQMKEEHERWVQGRLADYELPSLYEPVRGPLSMAHMTTGAAVWQLIDGAEAYQFSPPPEGELDDEAVTLVDEFLQLCSDYGDSHNDINAEGMHAIRSAKRELQDYVSLLASNGLVAFGTTQLRRVPAYNGPELFNVAVLRVIRADDPGITPVT